MSTSIYYTNVTHFRSLGQFLGPLDHIQNRSLDNCLHRSNSPIYHQSSPMSSTPPSTPIQPLMMPAWTDRSYITSILSESNHSTPPSKSQQNPIVRPTQHSVLLSSTARSCHFDTPAADHSLQHQAIQFGSISNVFLATPDLFPCRAEIPKRASSLTLTHRTTTTGPDSMLTFSTTSSTPNLSSGECKRQNYAEITAANSGMINIPQWLKSLRLHKYNWIFESITYDRMLSMTEDYLARMNITKGARDKLLMCIAKLNERYALLCQMTDDLRLHRVPMGQVLDELAKIVVTPMKPIQMDGTSEDIGRQLLNIFHLGKFVCCYFCGNVFF